MRPLVRVLYYACAVKSCTGVPNTPPCKLCFKHHAGLTSTEEMEDALNEARFRQLVGWKDYCGWSATQAGWDLYRALNGEYS